MSEKQNALRVEIDDLQEWLNDPKRVQNFTKKEIHELKSLNYLWVSVGDSQVRPDHYGFPRPKQ